MAGLLARLIDWALPVLACSRLIKPTVSVGQPNGDDIMPNGGILSVDEISVASTDSIA